MPWAIKRGKLAVHIVPTDDIKTHIVNSPCWCGVRVDYPHTNNVIHTSFLPSKNSEDDDPLNPDPVMTQQ